MRSKAIKKAIGFVSSTPGLLRILESTITFDHPCDNERIVFFD
jgi:hypothetical protein